MLNQYSIVKELLSSNAPDGFECVDKIALESEMSAQVLGASRPLYRTLKTLCMPFDKNSSRKRLEKETRQSIPEVDPDLIIKFNEEFLSPLVKNKMDKKFNKRSAFNRTTCEEKLLGLQKSLWGERRVERHVSQSVLVGPYVLDNLILGASYSNGKTQSPGVFLEIDGAVHSQEGKMRKDALRDSLVYETIGLCPLWIYNEDLFTYDANQRLRAANTLSGIRFKRIDSSSIKIARLKIALLNIATWLPLETIDIFFKALSGFEFLKFYKEIVGWRISSPSLRIPSRSFRKLTGCKGVRYDYIHAMTRLRPKDLALDEKILDYLRGLE